MREKDALNYDKSEFQLVWKHDGEKRIQLQSFKDSFFQFPKWNLNQGGNRFLTRTKCTFKMYLQSTNRLFPKLTLEDGSNLYPYIKR